MKNIKKNGEAFIVIFVSVYVITSFVLVFGSYFKKNYDNFKDTSNTKHENNIGLIDSNRTIEVRF